MTKTRWTPIEHYTRIEANEQQHSHPDCGCTLENVDGAVSLYHCPLHAAAPALYEALREMVACHDANATDQMPKALAQARAALALAEGR